MNIPNMLTLLRVALIPVFILLLMTGYYYASAGVFVFASLTDALDGHIARKKNLITDFGKLMDPLADKLLVVSALVCLTVLDKIAFWMVIIILAREFTITGLRSVAASSGEVLPAGWSGKVKTASQMTAIVLILLLNWPFRLIGIPMDEIVLWIAVVMTVYSGADYIIRNRRYFSMKNKG